MKIPPNSVVVFDLDDTLYKERDFVRSGFHAVAKQLLPHIGHDVFPEMFAEFERGSNQAFDMVLERYEITALGKADLLSTYRLHQPTLVLPRSSREVLIQLQTKGCFLGVLSDGRSATQRNKLHALGIADIFKRVVISEEFGSEKPSERNYEIFEIDFPDRRYIYVADNVQKDFITANARGWTTICLKDNGENIHRQDFSLPAPFQPKFVIEDLVELLP